VQIDKGMKHGQKIVLQGMANEEPGTVPGDVVFVLAQKEHAKFVRKGDDLLYQQKLKLSQALCGGTFIIEQLDGRKLVLKTEPGQVMMMSPKRKSWRKTYRTRSPNALMAESSLGMIFRAFDYYGS